MSQEQSNQEQTNQEQMSQEQMSQEQTNTRNSIWRWYRPGDRLGQRPDDRFEETNEWGNSNNEIILPVVISVLTDILSPHTTTLISPPDTPLFLSHETLPFSEQNTPSPDRKRGRQRDSADLLQNKSQKSEADEYSQLFLKSGKEFYFNKRDGINIILNDRLEPNRLIRNIISRVPYRLKDRLKYLAYFDSEEEEREESNKDSNEDLKTQHKKKRYDGNLKELVYEAYIKESRLRCVFKKVLALWRCHKMDKSCEIGLDPITLAEPVKKVYVYDWSNKKKFVFDAKSLATLIESKLTYQEYGFSMPLYPRNPNNNVDFTYRQLVTIYYQLKEHGELRWGFTTLKEYDFNLSRWLMYHKSALTMNSIKRSISLLDTNEDRELFSDFIFAKLEKLRFRINAIVTRYYQIAMIKDPKHWYLERLKALAISHYEGEHFGYYIDDSIDVECMEIFQKQPEFFKDLRNKKLI